MKVKQIRSSNVELWKEIAESEFTTNYVMSDTSFIIDSSKTFQSISGFGGAVTESACSTILEASSELQSDILKSYYSSDGLKYNLGRLHIASSDFSLGNYEYLTSPNLDEFDMSHEDKALIPLLKRIDKVAGNKIQYLASPWSPPAFMKTNNERNYGGHLLRNYYSLYASYLIKYLEEMEKKGIDIFALSVQNEPAAVQTWDSCHYSAEDERDFVRDFLGPKLKISNENLKVLVWDHNRGNDLIKRSQIIFSDKKAASYIYGVGFHWYMNEDYESLSNFHNLYPDKSLMFTEGCIEYSVLGKDKTHWTKSGEHYARHMINDFNNYNEAFIDWNIVLNEMGGPNHVGNYCEAPIMYDRIKKEVIKNSSYYYIGHFSRYINVGAKRVLSVKTSSNKQIHSVSFIQNSELITIVLNEGWISDVTLVVDGQGKQFSLPNNSISTFIVHL